MQWFSEILFMKTNDLSLTQFDDLDLCREDSGKRCKRILVREVDAEEMVRALLYQLQFKCLNSKPGQIPLWVTVFSNVGRWPWWDNYPRGGNETKGSFSPFTWRDRCCGQYSLSIAIGLGERDDTELVRSLFDINLNGKHGQIPLSDCVSNVGSWWNNYPRGRKGFEKSGWSFSPFPWRYRCCGQYGSNRWKGWHRIGKILILHQHKWLNSKNGQIPLSDCVSLI